MQLLHELQSMFDVYNPHVATAVRLRAWIVVLNGSLVGSHDVITVGHSS